MTFPVRSQPGDFSTHHLKRNSVWDVRIKIVTIGVRYFWCFFLGAIRAFEPFLSFFLGSSVWKKKRGPFQVIAKNVAFEKTHLITVTKSLVLLHQHRFCGFVYIGVTYGLVFDVGRYEFHQIYNKAL